MTFRWGKMMRKFERVLKASSSFFFSAKTDSDSKPYLPKAKDYVECSIKVAEGLFIEQKEPQKFKFKNREILHKYESIPEPKNVNICLDEWGADIEARVTQLFIMQSSHLMSGGVRGDAMDLAFEKEISRGFQEDHRSLRKRAEILMEMEATEGDAEAFRKDIAGSTVGGVAHFTYGAIKSAALKTGVTSMVEDTLGEQTYAEHQTELAVEAINDSLKDFDVSAFEIKYSDVIPVSRSEEKIDDMASKTKEMKASLRTLKEEEESPTSASTLKY